jgi:uncharacterized protein (TIGR00645 family)
MEPLKSQSKLESIFECFLWNSRYCVLLAVIFGLLSSVTLFILGSKEVLMAVHLSIQRNPPIEYHGQVVAGIIGAIDLYLIGIVLLIFSFGIYELFISKIDIGRMSKELRVLEITTLDQLKNKLLKVIIMVMVVAFFKRILSVEFNTPLEMLYFALSIFAISFGVYFLRKQE